MSEESESPKKVRRLSWSEVWYLTKTTFTEFFSEDSFFHGAALAYYTVFSMVPIISLALISFGQFMGQKTMLKLINKVLKEQVGLQDSSGIMDFLKTVNFEDGRFMMNLVAMIALIISSSAMLASLRYSINEFYDLHTVIEDRKKRFAHNIAARLLNIVFLPIFGLLIVITYFGETVIISLGTHLMGEMNFIENVLMFILQHGVTLAANVLLFTVVFKYVNDAKVEWKLAFWGGVIVAVLLYLGQLLIKYYLKNYFFGSSVGVPGTILVILAWMYYSSQIIFLGAKFVKVYAVKVGRPIVFSPRNMSSAYLRDHAKRIFTRSKAPLK